ncbi:flippase [Chryseomicrobium palamuruense]|uniref:Flippase n=1 Tax=Chryseomicrobium palamuruense TaxID=682973 RepID=A0ABV8UUN2_9BACL
MIRRGIFNNEAITKIIKNSSWLVSDKVITMIVGVFVTAIVARYFGPEKFGQFNYALAFVTLFTAISTLGLETLTVKSILDKKFDEGTILCTSLILRIASGGILTIFSIIIIKIIEPSDFNLHILVLIMSIAMVIKAFEVIEYWVQAHQKAKISSIIRMVVYIISSGLKIFLVFMNGTVLQYATILIIDALLIGFALMIAYFKFRENSSLWRFNFQYARTILSQSWHLIISGLMVTLYMRIDQVMLGSMATDTELGVYSAAVRIAEMWYFIPMALIISFKPVIMKNKKENEHKYFNSIQILYSIVTWMGILFTLIILIFSKLIISILYGEQFLQAANILSISVFAGTLAMLGSARSIWMISEGLQRYTIIYTIAGLIVNVTLNLIFIPRFGGFGAATATLVAQVVNILVLFLFKETRISTIMIIKSFRPINLFKYLKLNK